MFEANDLLEVYKLFNYGLIFGGIISFFPFIIGWFINFVISIIKKA